MKKRISIISILIIIILIVVLIKIDKIGFVGTIPYTISKGECNSSIATYSDGTSDNVSLLNDKGECIVSGYYIHDNKVNINIGNINCGSSIEIEEIKINKGMNVYIKAKEKKGPLAMNCLCSPSLTIKFLKKVNSVILENENGIKLDRCA